jgi:hypothetical protein
MLQIKKVLLRGEGVNDATVCFEDKANILAGESDTGKSYIVHCLDYILGAEELKKLAIAASYSHLFVEFTNDRGEVLTLERQTSGGDLTAHNCGISKINAAGEKIAARRHGKSLAKDVTSLLFGFAGLPEAKLRKNDLGEVQRLTIRTYSPIFLVDEVSVIDEVSPVVGKGSFDATARKRMLSFMLSGKDDEGIIVAERKDIARAKLNARLEVISDLLGPIEQRQQHTRTDIENSISKIEETIAQLSSALSDASKERASLYQERKEAIKKVQHAESQLIAIDELMSRYDLLNTRYQSDLERLDFVSEGAHFFNSLQEVRCPLCDQLMTPEHTHIASQGSALVYEAAKAEAAKIHAHRSDLAFAVQSLADRRASREAERSDGTAAVAKIDGRIETVLTPTMQELTSRLDRLLARRIELETARNDHEQIASLRTAKENIEKASESVKGGRQEWEPLPSLAVRKLCEEIEDLLREWKWSSDLRVEFDQRDYDIIVDGEPRQSHGKGVRAILYSAFAIGLLRFCHKNGRPHPGFVLIDSPLTSYKKKTDVPGPEGGPIEAGVEAAFWQSLTAVPAGSQIIIIENKEPPPDVAAAVHYEWFSGLKSGLGERGGLIPESGAA